MGCAYEGSPCHSVLQRNVKFYSREKGQLVPWEKLKSQIAVPSLLLNAFFISFLRGEGARELGCLISTASFCLVDDRFGVSIAQVIN